MKTNKCAAKFLEIHHYVTLELRTRVDILLTAWACNVVTSTAQHGHVAQHKDPAVNTEKRN